MHRVSCDFRRILHVSSSCTKSFTCIRRSPSADCAAVKSDVTFSASARRRVTSSPCARCPSVRFVSNSVCCSVLQCVSVFLCVSLCVAVCCRVLPCVAVCGRVLPYVAVCCRVLPCVAVCCRVLPCVAVCCSVNVKRDTRTNVMPKRNPYMKRALR